MSTIPVLQTPRLFLRPIGPQDKPDIFRGLSHPQVIPYYGVQYDTLEATQGQMDWYAELEEQGTGCWWTIRSAEGDAFCGAVGLNDIHPVHRKCEIGCWLLPSSWGQGFMQEAFAAVTQHAFGALDLHRIEGFVETENHACKRALAKLDFVLEGTMRESEWKNGKWISIDLYALVRPDNWLLKHPPMA